MRRRADFTAAVRTGRRAATSSLVLHVARRPETAEPPRFGLIVSKAVGGSVVRHRVARQIRALCARQVGEFGPGDLVVVRALPGAAGVRSTRLEGDLELAIGRLSSSRPGGRESSQVAAS